MLHTYYLRVLTLVCLACMTHCMLTDSERDLMLVALTDIKQDTINVSVGFDSGSIPTWLKGNFIRHACSVFGETTHMRESPLNYIQHLFDCIPMATKFRLEDGQATFTNRRYESNDENCYTSYGRNMNESGVFVGSAAFTLRNKTQVKKCQDSNVYNITGSVPHVTWWKVGNEALAMSETPIGVLVDTENVIQEGPIQYNDVNMGYGSDVMFQNNPAHEQTEPNGTIWSTIMAFQFKPNSTVMRQWRVVYKVDADITRRVVGELPYPDIDLKECTQSVTMYPVPEARFGYMHSFAATQNYIVLPETAFLFNPCFYANFDKYGPYFPQAFQFESTLSSRILIMEKSTGNFVFNATTRPFFVTHQLGAYEDGDSIHVDMLMYNDSNIYHVTSIRGLLSGIPYTTDVLRITLNMTERSTTFTNLRPGASPHSVELCTINKAYYGRKYMFAYMVKNWDQVTANNSIIKLNVDTGEEVEYPFPIGVFPQEPEFVPRPNSTSEDDGVLLVQGIDARKQKAFLAVIDARNMSLAGHVTAPDYSTFGIHSRFYDLSVGENNAAERVFRHTWMNLIIVIYCVSVIFEFGHS